MVVYLKGVTPICDTWITGKGAAHPWCDTCGVRADLHPGSGKMGEAIARQLRR